jgi:hypothetical protein
VTVVGERRQRAMKQRSAELADWGQLLVEQVRTLRARLAETEDSVAAAFERAALCHPDRAADLRSIAGQAREVAKQLRERPTTF